MNVKVWYMTITVESKNNGRYTYNDWVIGDTENKAKKMLPKYCKVIGVKLIDYISYGKSDYLWIHGELE